MNTFADTVAMRMADGIWLQGLAAVMDGAKTYRASLSAVESTIDASMSVHSIDRSEDWVFVWGVTKETDKSGSTKNMPFHELWRINKDGKIDLMLQYTFTEKK